MGILQLMRYTAGVFNVYQKHKPFASVRWLGNKKRGTKSEAPRRVFQILGGLNDMLTQSFQILESMNATVKQSTKILGNKKKAGPDPAGSGVS